MSAGLICNASVANTDVLQTRERNLADPSRRIADKKQMNYTNQTAFILK